MRRLLLALLATILFATPSAAHEIPARVTVLGLIRPEGQTMRILVRVPLEAMRDYHFPAYGPGYLDIAAAEPMLRDAASLWILNYLEIHEGKRRIEDKRVVAARVSLPSDQSFLTWETALAHVQSAPLPATTQLMWTQAMLEVLIEAPITSDSAEFSIDPALAHLGIQTTMILRYMPPNGTERELLFTGNPGLVRLDPSWYQAALQFVKLGFLHILDGIDHLLFVLCLVIPFRKFGALVAIITAFTVAHSITLIASASGIAPSGLWFPPLIEMLIALSILYMALENIVGAKLERRWLVAFGFGLVHGFGFSFALRESLQLAGSHMLTSLLAFNVGVELGQIAVLAVTIPALTLLFRRVVPERVGTILLSAVVAHTAWHWMAARWTALRQYSFQWPAMDAALVASALRGVILILILAGAVWSLHGLFGRLDRRRDTRMTGGLETKVGP